MKGKAGVQLPGPSIEVIGMALFKLTETRYLDTSDIADIQYMPGGFSPNLTPGIDEGLVQTRSLLNIKLKNAENIRLENEEADAVWQAFKEAKKT